MSNKVLVVSNLYPSEEAPHYGSFVKNFVEELRKSEYVENVDLCVLRGRKDGNLDKIRAYLKLYISIFQKLIFRRYDLIYVHLITHVTLPISIVNIFKPLTVVFNIHGEDLLTQSRLSSILLALAKPALRKAKAVVMPSYYFKGIALKKLPFLSADKVIVSASGGVGKCFYNPSKKVNEIPVIGYVSRIDRGKGWDTLMEAIKILHGKGYNLRVKFIGGGLEVPMLQQILYNNPDLPVEYIGPVAHQSLPDYYGSFDLFVFPTKLEESLGLVGIESMAAGVPVVASKTGGIQDYVIDGKNGYFFKLGNAVDLSDKIAIFLTLSDGEKWRMSNQAKRTAERYRAETVAEELFTRLFNE